MANEPIEVGHESRHLQWRGRDESGLLHLKSADEILDSAKLSGHGTGISVHELPVHRADQTGVEPEASLVSHLCGT